MNDQLHPIHSVYRATEGEGIRIGSPQVFVRYQGCAVGCVNCDSMETWDFDTQWMQLDEVLVKLQKEAGSIKSVSVTGGDPLHPKNAPLAQRLIEVLKQQNYFVNIEAAGVRNVDGIFELVDFISYDFKTPSTQVRFNEKVFTHFIKRYGHKAQIKAVVANQEDFDAYEQLREKYQGECQNWVITPCYEPNEPFPLKRFEQIIALNEKSGGLFRVIGQQHKWLHGPDKLGI